jgi:hypothetical protein
MRSRVTSLNLEDEALGPLDMSKTNLGCTRGREVKIYLQFNLEIEELL